MLVASWTEELSPSVRGQTGTRQHRQALCQRLTGTVVEAGSREMGPGWAAALWLVADCAGMGLCWGAGCRQAGGCWLACMDEQLVLLLRRVSSDISSLGAKHTTTHAAPCSVLLPCVQALPRVQDILPAR